MTASAEHLNRNSCCGGSFVCSFGLAVRSEEAIKMSYRKNGNATFQLPKHRSNVSIGQAIKTNKQKMKPGYVPNRVFLETLTGYVEAAQCKTLDQDFSQNENEIEQSNFEPLELYCSNSSLWTGNGETCKLPTDDPEQTKKLAHELALAAAKMPLQLETRLANSMETVQSFKIMKNEDAAKELAKIIEKRNEEIMKHPEKSLEVDLKTPVLPSIIENLAQELEPLGFSIISNKKSKINWR